ncbi:MAG: bifunctional ADP-dependent NAD(P)H-hydrate dehydratase/NAD(P)H-hydrate epimerase [Flavobacteriia bacterium]|nr:MAG: bifunctional ADP-dependent NAD(P)H-hydrate dehydratase/NAD(P)H-hydrate epimerase [Flavobacteriia bacterium]
MKILNASQIRATDLETIAIQKIKSIELMERAATKCFEWIDEKEVVLEEQTIHIFCGMGNNGGDGLALARLLSLELYDVEVYIVHFSDKMSDDFITNYNRLEEFEIYPHSIHSADDFPDLDYGDVIVDAIFGTGLTKAPYGFTKQLIQLFNTLDVLIIAIDVPSGLLIDRPVQDREAVVNAGVVLSFQMPKLAFLLPGNQEFVHNFVLLDIGLDRDFIESMDTPYVYTEQIELLLGFKRRQKFSHKGTYGHAMIMGGSFGKMGSVLMASRAAYKVGCGYVTTYIPKCGYSILQTALPEAMVEVDAENALEYFNYNTSVGALAVGPGLGTAEKTIEGFANFLSTNTQPLVLDADALNILALRNDLFQYLNEKTILTPHPGELERLIGRWANDYEKLEKVKQFSLDYHCVVVVKGAHTVVVNQGRFYFNSTGNAALAKAGMGDVLTGMIVGLLVQGYTPEYAARLAVYLHGLTADIYTAVHTPETFMPTDVVNFLPGAFNHLVSIVDRPDTDDDLDFDHPEFLDEDDDL